MITLNKIVQIIRPHWLSVQVPLVRRNFMTIVNKAQKFSPVALSRLRAVILKRRECSLFLIPFNNVGSMTSNVSDPSSHSRPDLAKIRHASLSLEIDFDKKIFKGNAVLTLNTMQVLNELVLDVSKDMDIKSIFLQDGTDLKFEIDQKDHVVGARLVIKLSQSAGKEFKVTINYATSPNASGLQWLDPLQTEGKTFPYVFSQCQPTQARSIMPCQDTPSVKFTYDAEITVPENFTVLMSALRDGQAFCRNLDNKECCTHKFRQPVPIPSYLMAIVVGVLQWKIIGPRTVVWAEGSVVERAAAEFSDTEKYLQAAENLVGPYVWTQYDLIVLPPSFPYGGMENPCLTFVTPTLLTGDKSLVRVIVHEIMHSWTGNLVTNKNYEHFWLNEGWTVFLERKISAIPAVKSDKKKTRDFESYYGLQELRSAIEIMCKKNPEFTKLIVNLEGVHPHDAFSLIPYEKGSLFLRYLEDLVGGPAVFDKFARDYLNTFSKKSLDSFEFKDYFMKYFESNPKVQEVKWDDWFYTDGMPPVIPEYDTSMVTDVVKVLDKILSNNTLEHKDVAKFSPHQMAYLLEMLLNKPALDPKRLYQLGEVYGISSNPNSEIKFLWYRLNIRSRRKEILADVFEFLSRVGRMKYCRPLYRDLHEWEEVRRQAIDHFLRTEPTMMHVVSYNLRTDLHLDEKETKDKA